MNGRQRNLYEFLSNREKLDVLVVENLKELVQAKQIFEYLKVPYTAFPDFRAEELDDLRSYREELFGIFSAISDISGTVIIPVSTLQNRIPNRKLFPKIKISFGDSFPEFDWNYFDEKIVQNRGEILRNGNRIDIFPINSDSPYRITLNSDGEIETIREFSIFTQRYSGDEVLEIEVIPYFHFEEYRKEEILEEIEARNLNSKTADLKSYGLWFLKEEELFKIPPKAVVQNFSQLPEAKNIYKIELEERKETKRGRSSILLDELEIGEYIVHLEYGIGVFEALARERVLGVVRDFVKIRYFGDTHLNLPIENLHLISRYISASGKVPKIDKLGKGGFSKRAGKVRGKLAEIAQYIVDLGAKRKLIQTPEIWKYDISQFQNEAGFRYTTDQKQSVLAISEALFQNNPMDHLLIGDVGFGKTEVAMNIIYLVSKSNFQSAMVVPTTLLAKQHYKSLSNRLENYGVKVAHIDRFVKAKERREIAKRVQNGEIDVVVGTHSILDLKFKNLTLFIVDEEHKFGVKQKSKLQEAYSKIHLLSMSATPIPRTLHQALSQLKTISYLNTPPEQRIGVKTFFKNYDENQIKSAVFREVRRGGQIFYIFNSIAEIENKKIYLEALLPNIKILVLHSKVASKFLEEEIVKFEEGVYDILLSTTIVGAGIHIPNANTIIVESADRFGIADLHQLRGRVGRGEKEGFCYLFVEDMRDISEKAERRLLALEQNSTLGSGSALAKQDLEIRGGGNIAGESQSGHIDSVGYSLYISMLEKEIERLTKSGEVREQSSVDIQLKIEAFIPETYISEEVVRLDIYRRASKSSTILEVDEVGEELFERFGQFEREVINFLEIIKIRILSEERGVRYITNSGKTIFLTFVDGKKRKIEAKTRDEDDILDRVMEFLNSI
jgi:transcription-repair coupling factor (superfamily II helicase)